MWKYILVVVAFIPAVSFAQDAQSQYLRGTITEVHEDGTASVLVEAETVTTQNALPPQRWGMPLREGDAVVLQRLVKENGDMQYLLTDRYRLPALGWLLALFLLLGVLIGRRSGVASIGGLLVSIGLIGRMVMRCFSKCK